MSRLLTAGLALAATLLGTSAAQAAPPARDAAQGRTRLLVAAASSLRPAAIELAAAFEASRPDVEVELSFGASGAFFAQLQQGAPFDLFLSADREYPARLVAAGLARPADERRYAFGVLVAWVPAGSSLDLERRGLAALADPAVRRIAIANPAVAPFGRAAEQALRRAGILDVVRDRLVLGTSVAQAAQFATTGAADAALLPRALALGPELAGGRVVRIPEALAPRIEQSGVVPSASRAAPQARALLEFLLTAPGRAILDRHGYEPP